MITNQIDNLKPSFSSIDKTAGTVFGANVTYNAGTVTYSSSTITYGGFAGNPFRAPNMQDIIKL